MMWGEAQELETPFLLASLRLYKEWSCFKILPHGKGTLDERQSVINIIRILSEEENRYSNWELDRSRKELDRD